MDSFISEKFGFDSPANIHFTKKFREFPGQHSFNQMYPQRGIYAGMLF